LVWVSGFREDPSTPDPACPTFIGLTVYSGLYSPNTPETLKESERDIERDRYREI